MQEPEARDVRTLVVALLVVVLLAAAIVAAVTRTSGDGVDGCGDAPQVCGRWALGPSGVGSATMGTPIDLALDAIREQLGLGLEDANRSVTDCPGGLVNQAMTWGSITVLFGAASGSGQRVAGWSYGTGNGRRMLPALWTEDGVTVGDAVAKLRTTYGSRLSVTRGDEGGPTFRIGDGAVAMTGTLSGTADDDVVVRLRAGAACDAATAPSPTTTASSTR